MISIEDVVSRFRIGGRCVSYIKIGSGHINESYLVITDPVSSPDYLLQRINQEIFRDIPGLTNNILIVTRHIGLKSGRMILLLKDYQNSG
jgi:hypothetical protein